MTPAERDWKSTIQYTASAVMFCPLLTLAYGEPSTFFVVPAAVAAGVCLWRTPGAWREFVRRKDWLSLLTLMYPAAVAPYFVLAHGPTVTVGMHALLLMAAIANTVAFVRAYSRRPLQQVQVLGCGKHLPRSVR
jgi:hypothetical protein